LRFAVIVFPGTWSDGDCYYVLDDILGQPTDYVWHRQADLSPYDCIILPGGFSYGDYLRAGAIARFSPVMEAVVREARAGKLVLGICNGFQILVNLGLLPGLPGRQDERLSALLPNDYGNFRDDWVFLQTLPSPSIFTRGLDLLELPVRHGEGKFYAPPEVLKEIQDRGQIALIYADPEGRPAGGRFPANPNGSLLDIAGLCDATGRVLGLMPHPEAHIFATQHPAWTRDKENWRRRGEPYPDPEGAGMAIFKNAVKYLEERIGGGG